MQDYNFNFNNSPFSKGIYKCECVYVILDFISVLNYTNTGTFKQQPLNYLIKQFFFLMQMLFMLSKAHTNEFIEFYETGIFSKIIEIL